MACNPVKFADLGKDAKDLLNKNFHFGVIKLDANTKSSDGVDFHVDGTSNTETGNVCGGLETKFKHKDFTFTEKWNTDNIITTNIVVEDKLVKGLKTDFDVQFTPSSGKKSAKIKTAYKHEVVHTTHDVDLDFAGVILHGSMVTGYKGWMLGGQASYDTASSKLATNSVSLSYYGDSIKIHSGLTDMSKYFGSIHHKVSDKLSVAAALSHTQETSASTALTVGAHYNCDADTFCKVKIDNALRLGMSYITKLRDGAQVTLSALVNAKNLNGGGHKVGMSLDLDA